MLKHTILNSLCKALLTSKNILLVIVLMLPACGTLTVLTSGKTKLLRMPSVRESAEQGIFQSSQDPTYF